MAAGPGANRQSQIAPTPMLWAATDNDVIQVYNPLSEDFYGLVGHSNNVNTPFRIYPTSGAESSVKTEADVQLNFGISSLKNPDHPSPAQISTEVRLPASSTTSLQGGVAKVVVGQLVNEIMQRNGDSLKMADPTARHEVEMTIVQGTKNIQDILGADFQTERQQIAQAVTNLNEAPTHEEPFAAERGAVTTQENSSPQVPSGDIPKRSPGRPKQTSQPAS